MPVGLLDVFRMNRYEAAVQAAASAPSYFDDPSTYPIATPWSSNDLNRIVVEDVFGGVPVNTRAAAMRIPSVARARNVLVTSIARNPLVTMRGDTPIEPQPSWTTGAGNTSPQQRMAWTIDDLIFTGWSCWWRSNAARSAGGFPIDADRIPRDEWTINDDMRVEVNGQVVPDNAVIVIPGLHEGILSIGYEALCDTRELYANVRKRLRNPIPSLNLQQQPESQRDLTDVEIDDQIARWAAARRGENGGVSYTSKHLRPDPLGGDEDAALMIDARNAAAVDIARLVGVSASVIDATAPKASLNYETTEGRNTELVDRDLELYMLPIEARLSLDDVVPRGQRVAFDLTDLTAPGLDPTGPVSED